jgi:hypothetical protein
MMCKFMVYTSPLSLVQVQKIECCELRSVFLSYWLPIFRPQCLYGRNLVRALGFYSYP